ncbi:MAG: ABC transporter permease [Sporichthyaceae bacterium]
MRERLLGDGLRIVESLRFAVRGIVSNKMRSALTMLMILIGVASVITLVAVGTGSSRDVQASISRLGSNTLFVIPDAPTGRGRGGIAGQLRRALGLNSPSVTGTQIRKATLTYEDADALRNKAAAPNVAEVAPAVLMQNVSLGFGSASATAQSLIGTTPSFTAIDESTVTAGRMFTEADYQARSRLMLLGPTVANNIGGRDPNALVGQSIRVNKQAFTVIGILGAKGYSGQQDQDNRILAVGTAVNDALYGYSPPGQGPISAILVKSTAADTVPLAQSEVTRVLAQRHGVSLINADFLVFNASAVMDVSADSNRTLTILLAAVAGISLLVGGIGVMNIMLVSVTERTREIGIRKAIGANRRDIVGQFLGEAVFLSLAGGVLGVAVAFGAVQFEIAGVEPVIAPFSIYLAVGVSLATGLIFGLYPANRAAALKPIDALRYE